ncbi:acetolactate decarboxylase [Agrobacterium sp. rho-13.3]|uniref:acetolactate decarboxylase n=1 Tax=Agrobacterium sp. rho-13.3 TaxID=3072980 RepID=UPI002A0CDD43|nr:acetolactate decarboxylase [Agrobacterium sp. rho-13.3]MDX8311934.1 acetolactate decarboxylase [Agrobacterium sp. rho-13.3]
MPSFVVNLPALLRDALEREATRVKDSPSNVVAAAIGQYLGTPAHTVFQVSTSGALVAGVYAGVVSVRTLLNHGDFGLGTFANLDGEMVVLDGLAYQVQGTGRVSVADREARAPFAVVTRFTPDTDTTIEAVHSFEELTHQCDELRKSSNIFYAFRLDGRFKVVRARAVNPSEGEARLVDTAKAQSEFTFSEVEGTLVGIWSPAFSSAFSVPGYHFHFLSDDRRQGGHLLDCISAGDLRLQCESMTDFHLVLPETASFLNADLSNDPAAELAYAEQAH